jgi:hypothetical protein
MPSHTEPPSDRPGPGNSAAGNQPWCPVCHGQLLYLRGQFRCSRCYFSLCLDCDSGSALNVADAAGD